MLNYLRWQFVVSPQKLIFICKKTILYLYHVFSIKFLLKTLIEPWKKDVIVLVNPSLQERFSAFAQNAISRFLGFMIRTITIIAGIIIIVFTIFLSIILTFFWFVLPLVAIYFIYQGIILL